MGRPPTSGYCHTCRKRRIKCDRARPSCNRCLKAGYVCKGYELPLRMQYHVVVSNAETGSSRMVKMQTTTSTILTGNTSTMGGRRAIIGDFGVFQVDPSIGRQRDDAAGGYYGDGAGFPGPFPYPPSSGQAITSPLLFVPPELSLSAWEDTLALSHLFQAYGWANFGCQLLLLAARSAVGSFAYDCSRALAFGLLGMHLTGAKAKAHRDKGAELYGASLALLRTKIDEATSDEVADLVVPVTTLGMYAFSVQKDAGFVHHDGVLRMLQHCGPEYFQSPSRLVVFEPCRAVLLCRALVSCDHTFLAQPQWKTVPWSGPLSPPKSALQRLLDIMADIPGLIHDTQQLLSQSKSGLATTLADNTNEDYSPLRTALVTQTHDLLAQLAEWRWDWEMTRSFPGAVTEVELPPASPDLQEMPSSSRTTTTIPPLPGCFTQVVATAVKFGSVDDCLDMAIYNAVLLWLMRVGDVLARCCVGDANGEGADDFPDPLDPCPPPSYGTFFATATRVSAPFAELTLADFAYMQTATRRRQTQQAPSSGSYADSYLGSLDVASSSDDNASLVPSDAARRRSSAVSFGFATTADAAATSPGSSAPVDPTADYTLQVPASGAAYPTSLPPAGSVAPLLQPYQTPLLLPGEARFMIQPTAELMRIVAGLYLPPAADEGGGGGGGYGVASTEERERVVSVLVQMGVTCCCAAAGEGDDEKRGAAGIAASSSSSAECRQLKGFAGWLLRLLGPDSKYAPHAERMLRRFDSGGGLGGVFEGL